MQNNTARTKKPTLIGYLPLIGGIQKTRANYKWHSHQINIGDICYTYPGALIACGDNYKAWNFSLTAEQVNEEFSNVIFFIPCRIAPPPHDKDGYPFERATEFVSKLKIPFVSVSESIQSSVYEYEADFHKKLSPIVTRYLHTLADRSVSIGTRGEFSAEVLKKLGINNAEVVGCPSLYINGPQLDRKLTNLPESGRIKNVAVCYSNYQNLEKSRIRDFLAMASKRDFHYVEQSFNLIVKALHYPGMIETNDILKAMSVFHGLNEIQGLFRHGRIRYFTNYQLWKNFLSTMDFAFGARMHGLTPAVHAGVPAFFIAHDARVREMCDYFRLPSMGEADIPPDVEMEYFYSRCDYGDAVIGYPERYYKFIEFLKKNGITPNVGVDGNILAPWEPQPLPQVAASEMRLPSAVDADFFDLLCTMGKECSFGKHDGLDSCVRKVAQAWYDTRASFGDI